MESDTFFRCSGNLWGQTFFPNSCQVWERKTPSMYSCPSLFCSFHTRKKKKNKNNQRIKLERARRSRENVGVSVNGGTPKSSILIGFSIINHPFWGTPIFGNTHVVHLSCLYLYIDHVFGGEMAWWLFSAGHGLACQFSRSTRREEK